MAALPKRRISRTRGRKRRTHWKLSNPPLAKCEVCGSPVLSHHICKNCGTYHGRKYEKVLKVKGE